MRETRHPATLCRYGSPRAPRSRRPRHRPRSLANFPHFHGFTLHPTTAALQRFLTALPLAGIVIAGSPRPNGQLAPARVLALTKSAMSGDVNRLVGSRE
ncbi:hypothetical protein HLY00_3752 [Mycolicibacterium hippocampi]|uniref:Uncharacterized protein n=1 Tax=Mycolicibacterium hippocampi TaxID=659824 RepID=A0A850PWP9_9MYCO|nr:hypothetical protein [Mycolicibacterium hippocampi]